jgi:hypothetical protein
MTTDRHLFPARVLAMTPSPEYPVPLTEREMTEVHNLISITLRATNAPAEMRAELEAVKLKLAQLITELNFAFSPPSFTGALIRGVRDDLRTEEIGHQRMAP